MGECQAAVAEAVSVFGGLDILFCCGSEGKCVHSKFQFHFHFRWV